MSLIGGRSFLAFAGVGFLLMFLLAALQVTSRNALRQYAEDQLARIPWDITYYQLHDQDRAAEVRELLTRRSELVRQAESLFFLRTIAPRTTLAYIDYQPLRTPWLCLLSATSPDLLPPDLRPRTEGATLVLVGTKAQMGDAYLRLQNSQSFELRVERDHRSARVMGFRVERVLRVDPTDLNRWFMDQTSSPTLVPELGLIVIPPFRQQDVIAFDAVSRGVQLADADHDHSEGHSHSDGHSHDVAVAKADAGAERLRATDDIHSDPGVYFPDVLHVVRLNAAGWVSGWDLAGSRDRVKRAGDALKAQAQQISYRVGMDNNAGALLDRMVKTAAAVGLISLLAAIPLLWVAWILLAQLSTLLLLNERRLLGLLRLRGTPGRLLAQALGGAIAAGAIFGCVTGALLGTVLPLRLYAGGWIGWSETWQIQDPLALFAGIICALAVILWAGSRLIAFAGHVPPLEASGRVASVEARVATIRFGLVPLLMLVLGGTKLVLWILDWPLPLDGHPWLVSADRAGDFIAFPLFVYGLTRLVVSHRRWLHAILHVPTRLLAGRLGELALQHMETRPHRAAAVVMITAMTASLCLYPTIMTAVFDNKIERAARIQLGGELQITLNVPDLTGGEELAKGSLRERYASLRTPLARLRDQLQRVPGGADADYLVESLADGLYMRGRGFSSMPVFLIEDADRFLASFDHEPPLGLTEPFEALLERVAEGQVLASEALEDYLRLPVGAPLAVGRSTSGAMVSAPFGGSLMTVPGMPSMSVAQRDSFTTTRVDYLNHLFRQQTFLIAAADNPRLGDLDVLLTRAVLSVRPRSGAGDGAWLDRVLASLPAQPLEVRTLDDEVSRLGSDMYIFLARHNVRIYLIGGVLMAIIALASIALVNFRDDRRTLGLLRIRGCSPVDVIRFLSAGLTAPALVGMAIGFLVALGVGYGLTNVVWQLREIKSILTHLTAHLALSSATAGVAAILVGALLVLLVWFKQWVFRHTARVSIREA